MKNILTIILTCFLFCSNLFAQTVTTISNTGAGINDALILLNDGTLIGSDHSGTSVYKLPLDGALQSVASGINAPNGLEIDSEGNIYIGAPKEDKIYKLTPNGTLTVYIPNILNPNNIIWEHGTDNFIVASYVHSKIFRVTPDGTITTLFDGAPLNGPLGMTYDSDNILYIANFTDGKIFRVENNQLNFFAEVPSADIGGLIAAIGFLKYVNGCFYATGFGTNKIYKISLEGVVESIAGSGVAGTQDGNAFSARFYWPNGLASNATGDTLYVSDYNTHAIRIITDLATSLEDENPETPMDFSLQQNYPNPFNPGTTISYTLPATSQVSFLIYNSVGKLIYNKSFSGLSGGKHSIYWNGTNQYGKPASSGVYFYQIQAFGSTGKNFSKSSKMILLK